MIEGPVVTPRQQEQFSLLRWHGCRLGGMSSYLDFPRPHARDGLDYESMCEVWCHCFRDPERYLLTDIPRALISASDFTDPTYVDPLDFVRSFAAGRADFVYVCGPKPWQRYRKNWPLAARCVPLLCDSLDMRCVVIGEPTAEFPVRAAVSFTPPLPRRQLLSIIAGAKFLFVPSVFDASPRLITEALCLDVPVLVNRRILGGWKYVNHRTGAFFDDEHDVLSAAVTCLDGRGSPRAWFSANHGPTSAGMRLLQLLQMVDEGLSSAGPFRLASHWEAPIGGT